MESVLEEVEKLNEYKEQKRKEKALKETEDTHRFDKWRVEQLETNKLYGLKLYRQTLKLAREKGFKEKNKKLFDLFLFLNK